jgi:hypothetical protein
VNEGTNPTHCTDSLFFSSSFHDFSRGDDCVAQRLWGRLALNPVAGEKLIHQKMPEKTLQ